MKNIIKYIFLPITFCISSCTDNELTPLSVNDEIKTIIAIAPQLYLDGTDSRTSITMGTYPNFTDPVWIDGDTIGVYPEEGDQLSFPIVEGINTTKCKFDGGGWALKSTVSYTAYFPFNRAYYYKNKNALPISMLGQRQDGNGNSTHMGAYDIQIAAGGEVNETTRSISFEFKRKIAFVRMDLTAPKAASWTSITLESDALFTAEATMDLSSATTDLANVSTANTITLKLANVTTTTDNLSIEAYMVLLPVDLTNKTLSVKLTDSEGYVYSANASIENNRTNFEANSVRWIKAENFTAEIEPTEIAVSSAGNLVNQLTNDQISSITSLKISGNLNSNDIIIINRMKNLTYLDLENANIVSGGNSYYTEQDYYSNIINYTTKDNVLTQYIFYQTNIEHLILPRSVTEVEPLIASKKLRTLKMFDNVETYKFLMTYQTNIEEVILSNKIKELPTNTFLGCSNLKKVNMPTSLEKIGNSAFQEAGISTISIPGTVTSIGNDAFFQCNSLESIVLEEGITDTGEASVWQCPNLKSVTLPKTLTNIRKDFLCNCRALTSITIPENVTQIEGYAFSDSGITDAYIKAHPTTLTTIISTAFGNSPCENLYVPKGTKDSYFYSNLGSVFKNIIEKDEL